MTYVSALEVDKAREAGLDLSDGQLFVPDLEGGGYFADEYDSQEWAILNALGYRREDAQPFLSRRNSLPDLTIKAWGERDTAAAVKLAGPINTDSKVYMLAATGVGKTMFAMGLAAHLAAGKDFLAWKIPQARKVLYIDGEMAPRLIQQRRDALVQQLGPVDPSWQGRFLLASTAKGEPYEDLPPLDAAAGQEAILRLLERTGAEAVIFDNLDALTTGERVGSGGIDWRGSWRDMKPLRDKIQSMGIAQIWVHHANDDGKAIGDKTRENAMDLCFLLKRPDNSIRVIEFDMLFTKTREKHEGNVADFAPGRWSIEHSQWRWEGSLVAEIRLALVGQLEGLSHYALASAITGLKKGAKGHKAMENKLRRASTNPDPEIAELFETKDDKVVWRLPPVAAPVEDDEI